MKTDAETRRRGDAETGRSGEVWTLRALLAFAGLGLAMSLLAGCLSVNARAPKTVGTDSPAPATQPPDGRTNAQLIDENKALRKRMEGLEKANQDLKTTVKEKKDTLHQLEKRSKETEKELDRYN